MDYEIIIFWFVNNRIYKDLAPVDWIYLDHIPTRIFHFENRWFSIKNLQNPPYYDDSVKLDDLVYLKT